MARPRVVCGFSKCRVGVRWDGSGMQLSEDSARLDTEADVALPNAKLLNGDAELTRFFGCEDARMTMTICTAFRACTPRTARRETAVTDRTTWNGAAVPSARAAPTPCHQRLAVLGWYVLQLAHSQRSTATGSATARRVGE